MGSPLTQPTTTAKTSGGLRLDSASAAMHVTMVVPTGNSVSTMLVGKLFTLSGKATGAPPGPSGAVHVTVAAPLLSAAEIVRRGDNATTLEKAPRSA
jgi:hypothetical protein